MVVSHNIPALFTHLSMRRADRGLASAMQRLSTGVRINSAREDAAGLAIANKLNYQVGALNRASENATHGISLIQTAEGALNEVHGMLQRMRELAVQAATDTVAPQQRVYIQMEIDQLTDEINNIASRTEFNRIRILGGEADRVIDNRFWNPSAASGPTLQNTRSIVTTLFTSHQVPPGYLNFNIVEAGRPAIVEFQPELVETTDPETGVTRMAFAQDVAFTVSGGASAPIPADSVTVTARAGETWEEVRFRFNEQLMFLGMSIVQGQAPAGFDPDAAPTIPNPDYVAGAPPTIDDPDWDGIDPPVAPQVPNPAYPASLPNPAADSGSMGRYFFVTNLAGSGQSITLTGSLNALGFPTGPTIPNPDYPATGGPTIPNPDYPLTRIEDTGRDAVINFNNFPDGVFTQDGNNGGLLDSEGNQVAHAALGWVSNGNQIFVRGSMGEDIRMNLQVRLNPVTGLFEFPTIPSGIPINSIGETGGDFEDGMHMSKNFRNFGPLMFQIGPSHNTAIPVQIPRINAETLGLVEHVGGEMRRKLNFRNVPGATVAMGIMDRAIETVSTARSRLGAYQNRLESAVSSLDVAAENTEFSRSRIMDTDMARESTRFALFNVQYQAAMAILGQANQRPQQLIQLLQ